MGDALHDAPAICPVTDWTPADNSADPIGTVDQSLAALASMPAVLPGALHVEEKSFGLLNSICNAGQITAFKNKIDLLTDHLNSVSPEVIAAKLGLLYSQAYRFDEATGQMVVPENPANQEAKRQLDFWIAAIENKAYRDKDFLKRVDSPAIQKIIALNSPNMTPEDRGLLHQLETGEIDLKTYLQKDLAETGRFLDRSKRMSPSQVVKDPDVRFAPEVQVVLNARYGDQYAAQVGRAFPVDDLRRMADRLGLGKSFDRLRGVTDNDVLGATLLQMEADGLNPKNPAARRASALQIATLIDGLLESREVDVHQMTHQGMAALLESQGTSAMEADRQVKGDHAAETASRLDDYRVSRAYEGALQASEKNWSALGDDVIHQMELSPEEETRLKDQLAKLDRLGPKQEAPRLEEPGLFDRFVGEVMGSLGVDTREVTIKKHFTGADWRGLKEMCADQYRVLAQPIPSAPNPSTLDPDPSPPITL